MGPASELLTGWSIEVEMLPYVKIIAILVILVRAIMNQRHIHSASTTAATYCLSTFKYICFIFETFHWIRSSLVMHPFPVNPSQMKWDFQVQSLKRSDTPGRGAVWTWLANLLVWTARLGQAQFDISIYCSDLRISACRLHSRPDYQSTPRCRKWRMIESSATHANTQGAHCVLRWRTLITTYFMT